MKRKKGFTIVELLSVIIILGIVLGITITAYVNINKGIDVTYYKAVEQSLLSAGTHYYSYTNDLPSVFGDQKEITAKYLVDNGYTEEGQKIVDSRGKTCDLNKSYVGAYKDSLDKTNYYVCLSCGEYETDSLPCNGTTNYRLNMRAKKRNSGEIYNLNGKTWSSEDIEITFETLNDMKEAILEDRSGNQKKCSLVEKSGVKSCSVIVDKSGKYEAYATGSNGVTSAKEEITVLIDKTAPTFDIENRGVNDKIEIEATSGLTANITNRVKNINDSESGIKTVEYSLEKRSDKVYYRSVKVATSFDINQTKEIEKYNLIVRVENNAGLKTEKTINYELYKKIAIPTADNYCKQGLVYTGSEQELTKTPGEGLIFTDNKKINAGSYTVTAKAKDNYRFTDNTTSKTIICSIAKANPTLTLSATTGKVDGGQTVSFNEKASVKGKFSNVSGSTGIATVSPGITNEIAANTNSSVSVKGVGEGKSTITVTFTPTDTTNYNTKTATYTVTVNMRFCGTFNTNGATSVSASSVCCTAVSATSGCNITAPTITRSGWNIVGFSTSSTSHTGNYSVGSSINLKGNQTFYAITSKSITLTIDTNVPSYNNGSVNTMGSQTKIFYNKEPISATFTIPEYDKTNLCVTTASGYEGYQLNNLSTVPNGEVTNCFGTNITITENTTLYAKWQTVYGSFTMGGGTNVSWYQRNGRASSRKNGVTVQCTRDSYYDTDNKYVKVDGSSYRCSGGVTRNIYYNGTLGDICGANSKNPGICSSNLRNSCNNGALACPTTISINGEVKIMAASDAKKTATSGSCNNVIYNGKNQTLASGGKNVTYVNNKALDAGTYQVTAVSNEGYAFADGTTSTTLTCSVDKKEVPVIFSNTKIEYTGSEVSPIATAYGINGENIELVTTKASSIGNYMTIASMKGINNNYTLKNTVADYEIVEDEIEETEKKIKTTYTINYYLMNQDGKNYTLFESKTSDCKVGDKVKGEVNNYSSKYITPKEIEIEIVEGENIINYYYDRINSK